MALPHVYILTRCRSRELLVGATLTFKSLRVGFPNAPVLVLDANTAPELRDGIGAQARTCGAQVRHVERHVEYAHFITKVLSRQRQGAVVFVDPDMCFWQSIEDWRPTGLAAGRYIPRHFCDFTTALTEPRLHTSLLWIPDVAALRDALQSVVRSRLAFHPFRQAMVPLDGGWRFFDTAAGMYGALHDRMQPFSDDELDAYDHLFAGTYADSAMPRMRPETAAIFRPIHEAARKDYRLIKGCWRRQDEYFYRDAERPAAGG